MFILPNRQSKKWSQPNNSDRFGTLFATRNMDFDTEGYARLAKRPRSLYDSTLDADFGEVIGMAYDNSVERYYVLTEGKIFYIDSTLKTVTEDANANVPTNISSRSDIVSFNDYIYVSAGITDDLRRWSGSAWSTSVYSLTSDTAPMAVFENKVQLAIAQGNDVLLLNTSHVLQQTLVLPSVYRVTSMAWANNRLYIGTRHSADGEALLFEWDGNTSSANNGYPCGSNRINSVKPYKNSVAIFTGEGQLMIFNGGGFNELANMPVYYTNYKYSHAGNNLSGSVSHRGMVVQGDLIYLNLVATLRTSSDNELQPQFLNYMPGGLWCYDPDVGLYHKAGVSADLRLQTSAIATGSVNTTTDIITVAGVTVPDTGTPVLYDDGLNGVGTAIGGIKHRRRYFTIKDSGTTLKLATSYANALANTAIDLTGTGNNAQFLVFTPNRDFGGSRPGQTGGLFILGSEGAITSDGSQLIYGGSIPKTSAATSVFTLNTLATDQENRGYLITPKLDATSITDQMMNVTVKFRGIKNPDDKIIVKWRAVERDDRMKYTDQARTQTGTWTAANIFTTTADLSLARVGDEVEIHTGTGMGYTAHITTLSESVGTYTVTIDESIQNYSVSDTMLFTIDNWVKEGIITTDDVETFMNANGDTITGIGRARTFTINRQTTWLQLKLELRGEDVAVEEILINNTPMRSYVA